MNRSMNRHIESLNQGVESLDAVQRILGDKFMFANLTFYVDKTQKVTNNEYRELENLGWIREGDFYWRPRWEG